jgi:hypothetical protein
MCSSLATSRAGWSEEMQREIDCAMFSTSALKENWASAYYWRCLLAMIGWSI